MSKDGAPPEPWRSFLRELDEQLTGGVELHCIGGFVVSLHYGIGRQTSDIDFLTVVPRIPGDNLEAIAGQGSALSKLERNAERDRDDVVRLARAGLLDAKTLKARYEEELRPYLTGNVEWHDKTAQLWLEMCWPSS